ncbi:hypothetical protein POVWA2_005630 [Plasmodium ovale wallikeri]|uniref:Uncharacterized protein n=1 Tax=Plasmodium ovale wallikeri TaxID=864142 RepID=A0A1A8YJL2_PLAOA|nr:hypothetical protein POVWA2_005630 [Plasmodium ovale wallikeri]
MCDVGERVFIWGNVAAFVFPFRAYEPCFFNSLLCRSAEATLQTWFSTGSSTGEAEARQQGQQRLVNKGKHRRVNKSIPSVRQEAHYSCRVHFPM